MRTDGWRRVVSAGVAALFGVVLASPLWSTQMEAPQYKGEERLHVFLHLGRVEGDLHEIDTLNQYVGVTLPLDAPELRIAPWWGGTLMVLAAAATLIGPPARRRRLLQVTLALFVLGGLAGVGSLQHRLYQMGHDRTRSVFARVEDFTPPIWGSKKIANFTVTTKPERGGWALAAAFALTAWGALARDRTVESAGSASGP